MPFNADTGEWTDGFEGKQSGIGASVPSLDAPAQIDPSGAVTNGSQPPATASLEGGTTSTTTDTAQPLPNYPDPVAAQAATDSAPPSPAVVYPDPAARQREFDAQQSGTAATAVNGSDLGGLTRQRIMDLLNTPQDVSAESVATSPEMQAEKLQSEQSTRRQLAQAAEQAAQGGYSASGGQNGIQRGIVEQQGINDTTAAGTIASNLRNQKISELTQGITFALQSGQFDQAQALQLRLAQLQSDTTKGIANDQIGYNYTALQEQANRDALLAALGGA